MKSFAAAAALIIAIPLTVSAQGIVRGAEEGARDGSRAAGPVGGVVGGVVGAVGGGVAGLLGIDQRPRFQEYVVRRHPRSYAYDRPLEVGVVLPERGVTYYEIPREYGVRGHRYTVVNGHTVLVEPRSRRVVEVID